MRTVYDVKKALNPDLFVDLVNEWQDNKRKASKPTKKSPRRNRWGDLFPVVKVGK